MACLLGFLELLNVNTKREDHCKWLLEKNDNFSVKSCYRLLKNQDMEDVRWENIWNLRAPSKVVFFSFGWWWKEEFPQLITLRGMVSFFIMFVPFAWMMWSQLFTFSYYVPMLLKFGTTFLLRWLSLRFLLGSLQAMAEQWVIKGAGRKGRVVWRLMLPAIWWSIWLEHNNRVFENYLKPAHMVFKRAKEKCIFWSTQCKDFINWSIVDVRVACPRCFWGPLFLNEFAFIKK